MSDEIRISVSLQSATISQLRAALARTEGRCGTEGRRSARQYLYLRRRQAIRAELARRYP